MENYKNDVVKSLFSEMANDNLKKISKMIKDVPVETRLQYLKASNPSSLHLEEVYRTAKEIEDYEVCIVAKVLLSERGIEILN